jgi:putative Mn2+ efflux pump MntP
VWHEGNTESFKFEKDTTVKDSRRVRIKIHSQKVYAIRYSFEASSSSSNPFLAVKKIVVVILLGVENIMMSFLLWPLVAADVTIRIVEKKNPQAVAIVLEAFGSYA